MAEDTIEAAALVAGLDERPSQTVNLRLHGWLKHPMETDGLLSLYGSNGPAVRRVMAEQPGWDQPLHPNLPYFLGEVSWGVRREMARRSRTSCRGEHGRCCWTPAPASRSHPRWPKSWP